MVYRFFTLYSDRPKNWIIRKLTRSYLLILSFWIEIIWSSPHLVLTTGRGQSDHGTVCCPASLCPPKLLLWNFEIYKIQKWSLVLPLYFLLSKFNEIAYKTTTTTAAAAAATYGAWHSAQLKVVVLLVCRESLVSGWRGCGDLTMFEAKTNAGVDPLLAVLIRLQDHAAPSVQNGPSIQHPWGRTSWSS